MTGDPEQFAHQYLDQGTDFNLPGRGGVASPWPPQGAGGEHLTPPWQAADGRRAKHAAE